MKYNDLDLSQWKESGIDTDSLWLINARDKTGKHKNIYHGNFIPQIPEQLLRRFTKKEDLVLEPFMGSGTTLYVCEKLQRKYVGFDINPAMIKYVASQMEDSSPGDDFVIESCNSLDERKLAQKMDNAFRKLKCRTAQFLLMHPPYMDIVKFTDKKNDLSQIGDIHEFVEKFIKVCDNFLKYLDKNRYFAVVVGDVYKKSEVLPLAFYTMDSIKGNFKVKLKGIIVKNIEGNRGKLGQGGIWKYRALKSDYYIFKHEYIFVFKKEF